MVTYMQFDTGIMMQLWCNSRGHNHISLAMGSNEVCDRQ
jgi:hypothetical protein